MFVIFRLMGLTASRPNSIVFLLLMSSLCISSDALAARTSEMYRMEPRAHGAEEGVTQAQIDAEVIRISELLGWSAERRSDGVVDATIIIKGGKHKATVAVISDQATFAVHYVTSYNLGYKESRCPNPFNGARKKSFSQRQSSCKEIIHPIYNTWVRELEDRIRAEIALLRPGSPSSSTALDLPIEPIFIADEIRKLKTLRDEGVVSDAEFQRQKEKLLGTPAPSR